MLRTASMVIGLLMLAFIGLGCEDRPEASGSASGRKDQKSQGVRLMHNSDAWAPIIGFKKNAPDETLTPPNSVSRYVDIMAGTGVTDMLINVNAQRVNYRSDVWEAVWDNQEDNDYGAGQRAFHEAGGDYPAYMMQLCRQKGMKAWISIRMNDSHYAPESMHDSPYHSTFWKEHPQWWVSPHRFITWHDRCLDYGQKEVRDHYMALVNELLGRYDMDGLELDFMRFMRYFRPSFQKEGTRIMNEFVAEVRQLVDAAEKRLGHKIELGVRVPTRPQIARVMSLDAIAWAKQGLVELIVAQSSWESSDSDIPVELWKELLAGADVTLAVGFEDGITSYRPRREYASPTRDRGLALAALHRGADAIYLMNHHDGSHLTGGIKAAGEGVLAPSREAYRQLLTDLGSLENLRAKPRHHLVTQFFTWADTDGLPPAAALPYTGRWGLFRLYIGPIPTAEQSTVIRLKVDKGPVPARVYLNGTLCWPKASDGNWYSYDVPAKAVKEGYSLIEVASDKAVTPNAIRDPVEPRELEREFTITWVEIRIQ